MFPLVVHLSGPIHSDELLLQLMVAALESSFGAANPLCTVHVIDAKLAVAWVRSAESREHMLLSSSWTLGMGISCRFVPLTSQFLTRTVEICSIGGNYSVDSTHEWKILQSVAKCDPREVVFTSSRLFLCYPTVDVAMRAMRELVDYLRQIGRTNDLSVRVIPAEQLQVVSTKLQAPFGYQQLARNLQQQNLSLLVLIQDSLRGSYIDYPVILGANSTGQASPLLEEETILLVCPSSNDVRFIESRELIALSSNCSLKIGGDGGRVQKSRVLDQKSMSPSQYSTSTAGRSNLGIILWDWVNCGVETEHNAELVADQLRRVILKSGGANNFDSFMEIIFVPNGSLNRSMLDALSRRGAKIVTVPVFSNADAAIRTELDRVMLSRFSDEGRTVVCLCSSSSVCGTVLSGIRPSLSLEVILAHSDFSLENYEHPIVKSLVNWADIITSALGPGFSAPNNLSFPTFSSSTPRKDFIDSSRSWEDSSKFEELTLQGAAWDNVSAITMSTALSRNENQSYFSDNMVFQKPVLGTLNEYIDFDLDGRTTAASTQQSVKSLGNECFVPLSSTSMVEFSEKLLRWGSGIKVDHRNQYLFGEDSCEYEELYPQEFSTISIERYFNRLGIVVRSSSMQLAELRTARVRALFEKASQLSQLIPLPGWTAHHSSALLGSQLLNQQEDLSKVSSGLTWSNGCMVAELLSLSSVSLNGFVTFLSKLRPVASQWRFPQQAVILSDPAEIEMFHRKFALKLEPIVQNVTFGDSFCINAFGFAELFDQAYAVIYGMISDVKISPGSRALSWHSGVSSPQSRYPSSMDPVRSFPHREAIKKIHRGSYSFADREAGIFFFAFEQQFREYLEISFSVLVEDSENLAEFRPKHAKTGQWADGNEANMDNLSKNVVLKISFYGNSAKNVNAARAYLEQLNTTNVARVQIFFPMVSAKKFKEIYNKKSIQLTMLNNERLRTVGEETPHQVIDPLHHRGFVNIRMKPPMHCHGIRKMVLPADVTITICGSVLAEGNEELLKEVEAVFNSIKSDYLFVAVSIPYTHPLKKQLTIKTMREEIIKKYGLVALKWEEGCRATGSVGTAKIWAMTQQSLNALLDEIRSAELESERFGTSSLGFSFSPQSQFVTAFANSAMPPHAVNSLATSLNALGLSDVSRDGDGSQQTPQSRAVVYLPDLTLRYVLLGPPLNIQMTELLQKFNSNGIRTKYPYRDRTDPHAALLLEGDSNAVTNAVKEANELVQNAAKDLVSVQVMVTDEQYRAILANDLACIKFVQGQTGVHMKLDPSQYENESARSLFDLRHLKLKWNDPTGSQLLLPSIAESDTNVIGQSLVAISVGSSIPGVSVVVAVMPSFSSDQKWLANVDCFLSFVTPDEVSGDDSMDPEEKQALLSGRCIKRKIASSFLFIWLWNGDRRENVEESDVFSKLDSQLVEGDARTVCVLLPKSSSDLVQQSILGSVVDFAKRCNPAFGMASVKFLCTYHFDLSQAFSQITDGLETDSFNEVSTDIESHSNSVLVQTLLKIVDKQDLPSMESLQRSERLRRNNNPNFSEFVAQKVSLLSANVPLPVSFFGSLVRLASHNTNRGSKTFLMKGLLPGVQNGLVALRGVLCGSIQKTS